MTICRARLTSVFGIVSIEKRNRREGMVCMATYRRDQNPILTARQSDRCVYHVHHDPSGYAQHRERYEHCVSLEEETRMERVEQRA